ncbi:hypothetical protein CHS0354_032774 [Potamilus streckersoni]|uniref:THD domain-containing protein n=1 Tax=Potamilus streckersoni TaxID=2493646 RepID=A0AAE0W4T1_9BIVA|nr:hypothetical protein CHS0354_032774 [Potamilus streckersoni]
MEISFRQIHLKWHCDSICRCVSFPNTKQTEQSCKKLFVIVAIINCILTAVLIVTTYYWKWHVRSLTSSGNTDETRLCLKCEKIFVHPIDDENILNDLERTNNGTKCCTKNTSQLKHLVHQFLERNHRIHMAKEGLIIPQCHDDTNEEKPAGRLVGVDHNRRGTDYEDRHTLQWQNERDYSYQTPGVKFTNGQLQITTPGYYWFNSRVTFRDTNTTIWNDRYAFFHTIYRRSAEYPLRKDSKLVEAGKTRCKLRSVFADRSSFIGDIAYFKKGESIIVKVSHPEMVSSSATDSFLEVRLY